MDIETIERCQVGSETVARQSSEPAVCDRVFVEIERAYRRKCRGWEPHEQGVQRRKVPLPIPGHHRKCL